MPDLTEMTGPVLDAARAELAGEDGKRTMPSFVAQRHTTFHRFDIETMHSPHDQPDRQWMASLDPTSRWHGLSAEGATELQAVRNLFRRLLNASDEELSP